MVVCLFCTSQFDLDVHARCPRCQNIIALPLADYARVAFWYNARLHDQLELRDPTTAWWRQLYLIWRNKSRVSPRIRIYLASMNGVWEQRRGYAARVRMRIDIEQSSSDVHAEITY